MRTIVREHWKQVKWHRRTIVLKNECLEMLQYNDTYALQYRECYKPQEKLMLTEGSCVLNC